MKRLFKAALFKLPYMTTCLEIESFLDDYIENKLPANLSRKFYLHLLMCSDCRKYLKEYKKTVETGKSICDKLDSEAPEDIPEEILKFVMENIRNKD